MLVPTGRMARADNGISEDRGQGAMGQGPLHGMTFGTQKRNAVCHMGKVTQGHLGAILINLEEETKEATDILPSTHRTGTLVGAMLDRNRTSGAAIAVRARRCARRAVWRRFVRWLRRGGGLFWGSVLAATCGSEWETTPPIVSRFLDKQVLSHFGQFPGFARRRHGVDLRDALGACERVL